MLDIIALKFWCCQEYYSCYECHTEISNHASVVWPRGEFNQKAILCGGCGYEMSVREYLGCCSKCPHCLRDLNPSCANHYPLYFQM
jgi:uncharacterized CHY-type Zn-finger protein